MFLLISLSAYAAKWCFSEDDQIKHTVDVLMSVTESRDCIEAFRTLEKQKSLDLSNRDIESIEPLQDLNFNVLLLRNNRISDITYLKGYSKLNWLDLSYNPLADLKTVILLESLQTLWLEGVPLSEHDLMPDVLCQNRVSHISLRGTGISSVEPFKKCRDLVFLGLANNEISDLSPLKDLKRISAIDVEGNPITSCPQAAVPDILSKCQAALDRNEQ